MRKAAFVVLAMVVATSCQQGWVFPGQQQTQRTTQATRPPRPRPINNNRISQTKCNEYSKLTVKTVQAISLSLDSPPQDLSSNQCDISAGLIVGGVKAGSGEFPHMAAIGYRNIDGGIDFGCGGSLISERFVLTAAHCRNNGRIPASIARFGVLLLTDSQAQDFGIESFIAHERYDVLTKQNDIAVIKLAKDVSFSDPQKIRPACLWQSNNIGQASTVASGFGYTEYGGSTSNELLKVKLDIIDNSVCQRTFEDEDAVINGNQICAGVLAGAKDTCSGDSGGPIQIVLPDNKCASYIIGITSFGGYCGGKNSPSVYTKVSAYLQWIESKVWR